jgi:hypothetical protein
VPGEVEILYLRSSARPVRYAIVLRAVINDEWTAVASIDNSHERDGVDVHHLHRYVDGQKQPPEPLPFAATDANDAMIKAVDWLAENREEFLP